MTPRRKSLLVLLLANLPPLVGLLVLGWSVVEPVMIYALEAMVMGLFFLARIVVNTQSSLTNKILYSPVFGGIYFILTGGELAFVLTTFFDPSHDGPTFLGMDPSELLALFQTAVSQLGAPWFILTIAGLVVAHARSFLKNSMRPHERAEVLEIQLIKPFGRVFALLVVVIPGGAWLYYEGTTTLLALLLVVVKTGTDLFSHYLEHRAEG